MKENYTFILVVFFTFFLISSYSHAAITVLGKGDATLCYHGAKFGYENRSIINKCKNALNDNSLSPKNRAATYVNLGIIYNNSTQPDKALLTLNKGKEYDGVRSEVALNSGNSYYLKKDYNKALDLYEKSFELGIKDKSAVFFNIGLVYEKLNNIEKAIFHYKKAIELKPEFLTYFEKKVQLVELGKW
tara:strand:+ start:251 stop:814 length:564 start_codon:yes stop_codon:yes gene_type:complete